MKHRRLAFTIAVFSTALVTSGQWEKQVIDNNINLAVSVDVADLGGDDKPDLVVTNFMDGKLLWYENKLPNDWERHFIAFAKATFAYCGDIDGDGDLDVAANLYSAKKMVWYENDHPTWTKHLIDETTDKADYMQVADINGDNKPDVIAAGGSDGGAIVWYENNDPGWTKHDIDANASGVAVLIATDFDDDGLCDVLATMVNDNDVVWFKNEGAGLSWTKFTVDDSLVNAWGLSIGDIDGDGSPDLVATTGGPYNSGSEVLWYENNHPTYTRHDIDLNLPKANIVAVTNIDEDGYTDIIAGGYSDGDILWYEFNGLEWTKTIIDENLAQPRVFAVYDLDGDSDLDVVAPGLNQIAWYKNPSIISHAIFPEDKHAFKIYPNPVNDVLHLEFLNQERNITEIEIVNTAGQLVYQRTFAYGTSNSMVRIDISSFSTGLYLVKVRQEFEVYASKVYINHP